jgi:hypothetical protein
MRKGRIIAFLIFLGLTVGVLTLRACGTEPKSATNVASSRPRDRAAKGVMPISSVVRPTKIATQRGEGGSSENGSESHNVHVSAPWGGGQGNLGRERPSEASPSGPMSFAVDGSGRVSVLDQVNGRIVRFDEDGAVEATFNVDRPTAQDMAIAPDGSTLVLDRFGGKDVALYDPQGNEVASLPLAGEGIDGPGVVTGVFVDGEEVFVEKEHGPLVHVGNTSGATSQTRDEIPGRPTRDGRGYIKAGITDAASGRAYVVYNERPSKEHRFTRELRLGASIWAIVLLDTDLAGTIYFAAEIEDAGSENVVLLTCLDPATGAPTGSALLPSNTLPEETFRDLVVRDGGGVVHALRTEEGVTYTEYDCE